MSGPGDHKDFENEVEESILDVTEDDEDTEEEPEEPEGTEEDE